MKIPSFARVLAVAFFGLAHPVWGAEKTPMQTYDVVVYSGVPCGIAREFYERLGKEYGTGKAEFYFESSVAEKVYKAMLAEAKIEVRYGVPFDFATMADAARMQSIALTDGTSISAKVFVDAGYEGDVMAHSGVSYTFGRESRAEYGASAMRIKFPIAR